MHVSPTLLVPGFGLLAMGALLYFCSTSPGSVRVLSGMMFQPDIDTSDMAVLGHALRSLSLMMVMVAVVNLKHAFLERAGEMPRSVLLLDIVFAGHFVAESYLYGVGTTAMTHTELFSKHGLDTKTSPNSTGKDGSRCSLEAWYGVADRQFDGHVIHFSKLEMKIELSCKPGDPLAPASGVW